jgi:hypothetical protein
MKQTPKQAPKPEQKPVRRRGPVLINCEGLDDGCIFCELSEEIDRIQKRMRQVYRHKA